LLGVIVLVAAGNLWIVSATRARIYTKLTDVPPHDIALVLATGIQTTIDGGINQHFFTRLKAAADLWHAGKAKKLLVSGSSHASAGDETGAMVTELMRLGVPKRSILRDDDSWRTLDSMVRVRQSFGATNVIVVSEQFHLARAVFLGQYVGVDAIGFAAADVSWIPRWKSTVREVFARVKAILDVYILHRGGKV
jgi:SanA protein